MRALVAGRARRVGSLGMWRAGERRVPERAWAVIAGGGTGGHVYPGLALASELVRRGHDPATLRFVGSKRGLEAKTDVTGGFPTTLLPGRGWRRGPLASSGLVNAQALFDAAAAVVLAGGLFAKWKPAVVVSFGGYASFPCVVAAALFGAPVVVVNLDSVPGLVNRWAARMAAACAEGVPGAPRPRTAARAAESVFTGVPVRAEMATIDRSPAARRRARERLGVPPDATLVAVSGGSLGSLRVNQATAELAQLWARRAGVAVRHVVGKRDWPRFAHPARPAGGLLYQVVEYEEDMASLYAAADVAVQRAGASTVAELALAGLPSLLVPLPGSPGDHQGANAQALARAGGAVVVPDAELDGARLASELEALLGDPARLSEMSAAAKSLARPYAARDLADLVERCARGAPSSEPATEKPATEKPATEKPATEKPATEKVVPRAG